jgi:E3 ubiquitin-protein ligase UBR4
MEVLVEHFEPYLRDWGEFDRLQKQHEENRKDDDLSQKASMQRSAVENLLESQSHSRQVPAVRG